MANKILNLAILAGLGYAGYNALSSKEKQAATQALGFTSVPQNEPEFVALIKSTIKADKELQRILTGPAGQVGATGATGPTGANGLAGDMVQNYGGSLIKNGALELGTLQGWTGGIIDSIFGMPVLKVNSPYVSNTNKFLVNPKKLHEINFYAKCSTGNFGLFAGCYDFNSNAINKSSGTNIAIDSTNYILNQANFIEKTMYLGGEGNLNMNFAIGTRRLQINTELSNNNGDFAFLSSLIFREVDLGKPVPHNLPYLPLNQTVLNNATGKVGIFNGTTVDYYM